MKAIMSALLLTILVGCDWHQSPEPSARSQANVAAGLPNPVVSVAEPDSLDLTAADLRAFLRANRLEPQQLQAVKDLLQRCQTVRLIYWSRSHTSRQAVQLAESLHAYAAAGSNESMQEETISATFSLFKEGSNPLVWLADMREPLDSGFVLLSVEVVLVPPASTRLMTHNLLRVFRDRLVAELESMKQTFPQLTRFSHPGRLTLKSWEDIVSQQYQQEGYLGLDYENEVGPAEKGPRRKYSPNWCIFQIGLGPISGRPRQIGYQNTEQCRVGGRAYPFQALWASWHVESQSPPFNAAVAQKVEQLLSQLDRFEALLRAEKELSGPRTGARPTSGEEVADRTTSERNIWCSSAA